MTSLFHVLHPLTVLLALPLVGAVILLAVRGLDERSVRQIALIFSGVTFLVSLAVFLGTPGGALAQSLGQPVSDEVQATWIPSLGISYHLKIDGLSHFLVLLTTFLTPLVILGSWEAVDRRVAGYHAAMLALESAMIGAFLAVDLFLFYVFWEAMLIPMYFLIGVWGGKRRIYATVKFFLYTLVGSLLMLVAIVKLAFVVAGLNGGQLSFDLADLMASHGRIPPAVQAWLFAAFAASFAIKVPLFPFHTWLPDAHVEAPTGGSVILAGILLKMGTYGFLRFAIPLFPVAAMQAAPWIIGLAAIGIVYGAWVASVQQDVKKLVAYSSVSHLGYVMLGLFVFNVEGMQGALLQMINHGLSTGALFFLVGMIYERRHTRELAAFGGIAKVMPVFAALFLVVTLSSIGLPGLNGFIGELLVLAGAFPVSKVLTLVVATGMIWGAVYMLTAYQKVFFGPVTLDENRSLVDLGKREIAILLLMLAPCVWIGVYPRPLLARAEPELTQLTDQVREDYATAMGEPVRRAQERLNRVTSTR
ncbi:MAG: NADH-quinone oxidoreductase subunit M [bacterium]